MPRDDRPLVLIRGGGDLASGVALRLHRVGFKVVITELPQPLAVRRAVSFAETVYAGVHEVEGVTARLVKRDQAPAALEANEIPVLIDPEADILRYLDFSTVVDGRLLKKPPSPLPVDVPLHIGLGPGFHAGRNCHAVVETRRSHTLGRVFWNGTPQPDTGQPEGDPRRVLRAPADGVITGTRKIGEHVEVGEVIAVISDQSSVISEQSSVVGPRSPVVGPRSPVVRRPSPVVRRPSSVVSGLSGVLRGLIHDGLEVKEGLKIGDVDPRDDPSMCFLVSDKSLAVGGGVLEALLTMSMSL